MALKSRDRLKVDPGSVYVAWQGYATDIDGVPYVVARGDRLRGDHPMVRAVGGQAFVADGVPEAEWPGVLDRVVADSDAEAEAAEARPKPRRSRITGDTRVSELVLCRRPVLSSVGGSTEAGTIMLADDPRATAAPEAFEPLLQQFE